MSVYNITGQQVTGNRQLVSGLYHTTLDIAPGIYFVKVISQSNVYIQKVYIQ